LDWQIKRLKHACNESAVYGANEPSGNYSDAGVRFLRTSDLTDDGKLNKNGGVFLEPASMSDYLLKDGDLLLSRSGTLGRSLIFQKSIHGDCAYAGYLVRFSLKKEFSPGFVFYFTKSRHFADWLSVSVIESTIGNINGQKYANLPIPFPSLCQQTTIAEFLDRETGKIDALVKKKERLIELLQEKRTALISHAVTQGLNPKAPKKDSGIPWLGHIPAHWQVKRLHYLTQAARPIMYGIVLPGPHVEDGVPIVKGGDVTPDRLLVNSLNRTAKEIEAGYARSRLRGGDLLYAIRGSIGMVEIAPAELEGANITQDAARVAPQKSIVGRWLMWALKSSPVFAQLDAGAVGATIRGINIRDLKRAFIPLPSDTEQLAISDYLDRETGKLDALMAKIRTAIERLQEYRTALISAAVTGQIDVRKKEQL
jgi:type I restriction enzyme S subunit